MWRDMSFALVLLLFSQPCLPYWDRTSKMSGKGTSLQSCQFSNATVSRPLHSKLGVISREDVMDYSFVARSCHA